MGDEQVVLTRNQMRVVQAVYDYFHETGTWPRFGEIDRRLDRGRRRLDAGRIVEGIPGSILQPLGSPPAASLEYPMRLTLEGVARCAGSDDDVALFLRALRWMARQERQFQPATASEGAGARADSQQFMRGLKIAKRRTLDVQRLGAILMVERWGWISGGTSPDQNWSFALSRDVRRFSRVQTLDDYRAVHESWVKETQPRILTTAPELTEPEQLPDGTLPANGSYVDRAVVAAIEAKQATSVWKCDKLLQLIAELNDNYERQNGHAAHAMLRAVLDHVPPVFGLTDFAQVANNYGWSRTDNAYVKRLLEAKLQGDEALHKTISRRSGLMLSIADLPPRRQVNRLLEECAGLL